MPVVGVDDVRRAAEQLGGHADAGLAQQDEAQRVVVVAVQPVAIEGRVVGREQDRRLAGLVEPEEPDPGLGRAEVDVGDDAGVDRAQVAAKGGLVLGVCNGFQILCESGLLPGVLMRNQNLKFICRDVYLRVERSDTPFTRGYNAGQVIRVPVAHGEGNYIADGQTIARLEGEGRVLFRYASPDGLIDPDWNLQRRHQWHRRHLERSRQRPRPDAASGKSRRGYARSDRRPRPVRGPRRLFQAGGVSLDAVMLGHPGPAFRRPECKLVPGIHAFTCRN